MVKTVSLRKSSKVSDINTDNTLYNNVTYTATSYIDDQLTQQAHHELIDCLTSAVIIELSNDIANAVTVITVAMTLAIPVIAGLGIAMLSQIIG